MKTPEEFAEEMRIASEICETEERHTALDYTMVEMLKDLGYGEGCKYWEEADLWFA